MLSMLPLRFLSASSTLFQLVRQGGGVAVRAFSNSLNSSILKQMKSSYAYCLDRTIEEIGDMRNCLNGWRNRPICHEKSI